MEVAADLRRTEGAGPGGTPRPPVLRLSGIGKSFGAVVALKGVDFAATGGEVHAIVGENGAGKSTLIGIAAGVLAADTGTIAIDGASVATPDAVTMRLRGLAVAFQHPALMPDLTVLENLQLVAPALRAGDGAALLRRVAMPALQPSPHRRVADLSLAQKHVVEIARAIAIRPCVLILDEPTEPFQATDARRLFDLLDDLKAEGVAIVYISHRLHEVMEIADRVSVLRDGEMVDSQPRASVTAAAIVAQIVGRPLGQIFPDKSGHTGGEPLLSGVGLSGPGFSDVSLAVGPGEILGLTGVEGQGQREVIRALAGLNRRDHGEILLHGKPLRGQGRAVAMRAGIGFVSDDRHVEGLFLPMTVRENLSMRILDRTAPAGVISPGEDRRAAQEMIASLNVKTPSPEAPVSALSGGNQQKVLFGREIGAAPRVLLVDEPTKGVDVGSRSEIYHRLRALAAQGTPVIVSSSDGVELQGLCDRVLVFSGGTIVQTLSGPDVSDDNITDANLGATQRRGAKTTAITRHGRLGELLSHDYFPAVVLALASAVVLLATDAVNPTLLTVQSLQQAAAFLSLLAFLSLAQLATMITGSIDLSVGPLAGLTVVLASFLVPDGAAWPVLLGGSVAIVLITIVIAALQGALIEGLRLPSMVVTLATFIGFQGISLLLRPTPTGMIAEELSDTLTQPIFAVPAIVFALLAVVILLERGLLRTRFGRAARALGSEPKASALLGLSRRRIGVLAFAVSGFLCGIGGLLLAAQVGVGSPVTGVDYTLMSITAVVLGGASITGGRGSFVATLFGAVLVQSTVTATSFLNINSQWQYWILGLITLSAAGLFSYLRSKRQ